MSNFAALIATIQANIKTNGNEEITGAVLQDVLEAMVQALGTEAINNLETALSNEVGNRQNEDGTLQNNIDEEALRAGIAEGVLQTAINGIKSNIDNGYVYAGIATPSGTPASGKVFYLAVTAGTYTNFGGLTITQGVNILKYNGTAWSQEQLIGIDNEATSGSNNLITSNAVNNGINKYLHTKTVAENLSIQDESSNAVLVINSGEIRTKKFDSRKSPSIENGDYDLPVQDENGNPIVIFNGGHILTKFFNSRNLLALTNHKKLFDAIYTKFENKKIAILGDSISTYQGYLPSSSAGYDGAPYGAHYPKETVDSVEKTWWWQVADILGVPLSNVSNCSWSGSTVTTTDDVPSDTDITAFAGCSDRRITDLSYKGWNPDIVLVFISRNDFAFARDLGTWSVEDAIPSDGIIMTMRTAYALMLAKIHTQYPSARIFCCTCLNESNTDSVTGWPADNSQGVTVYEWNENIIEIATAMGCDIIRLDACGITYDNAKSHLYTHDGIHPNADGMKLISKKVINSLISKF